ncbi:FAD-binding oxidoreductase (plasmid) [Rhizobium lusitanum]|uniref:NAD(P)/FAD-dependent oxidoreductase n=1 Tax=Rhizobium lusitanum TaxID=293958 RepID=UPI001610BBD2|nr:FAD-dependent oxidoreductase [Rhizobium lusitanum]QND44577.1 FAD-binding oxidoreductase [Rhizobium lusitanum]
MGWRPFGSDGTLAAQFGKRVAPINAYILATEPLPTGLTKSLLPDNRTYIEARRSPNYIRLSTTRLLFGGQTGHMSGAPQKVCAALVKQMTSLLPDLDGVRISHFWHGVCAAPRDLLPRVGVRNGIHFALGYCFSGNAMPPFLGEIAAKHILGRSSPPSIFEESDLPYFPRLARPEQFISGLATVNGWMDTLFDVQINHTDRMVA